MTKGECVPHEPYHGSAKSMYFPMGLPMTVSTGGVPQANSKGHHWAPSGMQAPLGFPVGHTSWDNSSSMQHHMGYSRDTFWGAPHWVPRGVITIIVWNL